MPPKKGKAAPAAPPGQQTTVCWVVYGRGQKMLVNSDVGVGQLCAHLCEAAVRGVAAFAARKRTELRASIATLAVRAQVAREAAAGGDESAQEAEEEANDLKYRTEGQAKALEAGVAKFAGLSSWQHVALCSDDGVAVLAATHSNRLDRACDTLKPRGVYTLGRRLPDDTCDPLVFAIPAITAPLELLHPPSPSTTPTHRRAQTLDEADLAELTSAGPPLLTPGKPRGHRRTRTQF